MLSSPAPPGAHTPALSPHYLISPCTLHPRQTLHPLALSRAWGESHGAHRAWPPARSPPPPASESVAAAQVVVVVPPPPPPLSTGQRRRRRGRCGDGGRGVHAGRAARGRGRRCGAVHAMDGGGGQGRSPLWRRLTWLPPPAVAPWMARGGGDGGWPGRGDADHPLPPYAAATLLALVVAAVATVVAAGNAAGGGDGAAGAGRPLSRGRQPPGWQPPGCGHVERARLPVLCLVCGNVPAVANSSGAPRVC